MIENNHSTIESDLSSIREDILNQQSVLKSMNRTECELSELSTKISSIDFALKSTEKTHSERIDGLEDHLCAISAISDRISVGIDDQERELTTAINRLSFAESTIIRHSKEINELQSTVESTERDSGLSLLHHTTNESAISKLDSAVNHLQADITSLKGIVRHLPGWTDSLIVDQCSSLFEEFRTKQWSLVWRGNRDGFSATDFHKHCDGCSNTLTLIFDTKGNIFEGFTLMKWANSGGYKCDYSFRSFIFTLKNPSGSPTRKFALRVEKKEQVIFCISSCGPMFGGHGIAWDILIADNCNANSSNLTNFDAGCDERTYSDDSDVSYFFIGSEYFRVNEIEIFEIAG
jgi:hypothetical protein